MLNDPNSVRLINLKSGDLFYIDEVLIPESVDTKEDSLDLNQLERHWKTEMETAIKAELFPVSDKPEIFMIEVIMVKDIFYIYFTMTDLAFSTKNRKKLVAVSIEKKKSG